MCDFSDSGSQHRPKLRYMRFKLRYIGLKMRYMRLMLRHTRLMLRHIRVMLRHERAMLRYTRPIKRYTGRSQPNATRGNYFTPGYKDYLRLNTWIVLLDLLSVAVLIIHV